MQPGVMASQVTDDRQPALPFAPLKTHTLRRRQRAFTDPAE